MKIKSLFFGLLLLSGMLFVGCEKAQITTSDDLNTTELIQRVANNAHFQQIKSLDLNEENAETALFSHSNGLLMEIPQLKVLEKETLEKIIVEASRASVADNSSQKLGCSPGYFSCRDAAFADFLHSYNQCTTDACRSFMISVYQEARQLCWDWYCTHTTVPIYE